nr:MAG TPA: hypothetical protein [Caudoviricetes sp.]
MENKGLEFGKIYHAGNFIIKKFTRTLTKKQMLQLRDAMNIPRDIQKRLERNGLPFIKASTVSGSWSIEWAFGMSFFDAINEMPVNENGEFFGAGLDNLTMILTCMFADASVVGDMEYMAEKQKLMHKYFYRKADKGEMTEEEIKESEEAADEVLRNEQHKETLLKMGKEVENGNNE